MLNIIKVKCPHCSVEGQLVLPESDYLIVGPCPECHNSVAIFAGKALALDTALLESASKEDAYNHIYATISIFVRERLDQVFSQHSGQDEHDNKATVNKTKEAGANESEQGGPGISVQEMDQFVNDELPLIDDDNYFRSIFG